VLSAHGKGRVKKAFPSVDSSAVPEAEKKLAGGYDFDPVVRAKSEDRQANFEPGCPPLEAVAHEQRITASYVTRVVRLAFLAPDIVAAILREATRSAHGQQTDGRHPSAPQLAGAASRAWVRLARLAVLILGHASIDDIKQRDYRRSSAVSQSRRGRCYRAPGRSRRRC
jgi:hypothetical protein